MERPNCLDCIHYSVTWDKNNPRGCKLFNLKTTRAPSITVFMTTGEQCKGFSPNKNAQKKQKEAKKKIDFNDKRYW